MTQRDSMIEVQEDSVTFVYPCGHVQQYELKSRIRGLRLDDKRPVLAFRTVNGSTAGLQEFSYNDIAVALDGINHKIIEVTKGDFITLDIEKNRITYAVSRFYGGQILIDQLSSLVLA